MSSDLIKSAKAMGDSCQILLHVDCDTYLMF